MTDYHLGLITGVVSALLLGLTLGVRLAQWAESKRPKPRPSDEAMRLTTAPGPVFDAMVALKGAGVTPDLYAQLHGMSFHPLARPVD